MNRLSFLASTLAIGFMVGGASAQITPDEAQQKLDAKEKAQPTTAPSEVSDLRRIIAGLVKQIDELKAENQALKAQLAARPLPAATPPNPEPPSAPAVNGLDPEQVGIKPGVKEADMLAYCKNHQLWVRVESETKDGRIYHIQSHVGDGGRPGGVWVGNSGSIHVTVEDGEVDGVDND